MSYVLSPAKALNTVATNAESVGTLAAPNPWSMVPPLGNLEAYISAVNRMPQQLF